MKQIKYMAREVIPEIDPNQFVHAIYSGNGLETLLNPLQANKIVCPTCGSPRGHYNRSWRAWCCFNESCWGDIPKEGGIFTEVGNVDKLPASFCVPKEFANISMKELRQTHEVTCKLKAWSEKPTGVLLLTGSSGLGKTYAACACMSHYLDSNKGISRFINYNDLYYVWKDCMRQYGDELDIITKYCDPQLVVLDDFGTRPPSDGYLEFIYQFFHRRSSSSGGMIITTNLTSQEVKEQYNDRILSRISSGEIIKFQGKDRRIKRDF